MDDVIGNTFGGAIGIFFYYIFHRIFKDNAIKIINIIGIVIEVVSVAFLMLLFFNN